jgi:phosphohistidine phosphatase SixA
MDPGLSAAGQARAAKLADFIPAKYGAPDVLFASAISKHSARPYETITPLSKRMGVTIDATFADQDYGALAKEILSVEGCADKCVVVCWHHGNIPSLAQALRAGAGEYPDPWNPAVFNLILQLDYEADDMPRVTTVTEPF